MNSNIPLVSIIIINYNGLNLLKKCLSSLFEIDFLNYEIILVDNNSTDDTIQYLTKNYPKIIIIKLEKNKGFAEPNNIASKIAKGEYLLFLNNDTIVTKNFLSELINSINKNTQIGICQSLLLKLDDSIDSSGDFIDELGVVYNSKTSVNTDREISSARGASMLIRKEIFDELKGFDEQFFVSFEDVDLGWRVWIKGYRVVLSAKSIVYHLGGQTTKQIKSSIAFHGFKNQLSMKITNFEPNLSLQKIIYFFILYGTHELKIWFDYSIRGTTTRTSTKYETNQAQKPNFKIILKSIFWLIRNVSYLRKKQKFVNSNRIISTKTLQDQNILTNRYQ
jgi:GT2 family glycosyltransferase